MVSFEVLARIMCEATWANTPKCLMSTSHPFGPDKQIAKRHKGPVP